MICPNCGNEVPSDIAFCNLCGASLTNNENEQEKPVENEQEAASAAPSSQPSPAPAPSGYQGQGSAPYPQPAPYPQSAPYPQPAPYPQGMPFPPAPAYPQPAYQRPTYNPNAGFYPQPGMYTIPRPQRIWSSKPIGSWGYIGLSIIFIIPIIGLIVSIVLACGGTKNINIRNYARSFLINLGLLIAVALILTVVYFATGQRFHIYYTW